MYALIEREYPNEKYWILAVSPSKEYIEKWVEKRDNLSYSKERNRYEGWIHGSPYTLEIVTCHSINSDGEIEFFDNYPF